MIYGTYKGKKLRLFTVKDLAKACNRDQTTIRRWERQGWIPPAPIRMMYAGKKYRCYLKRHIVCMAELMVLLKAKKQIPSLLKLREQSYKLFKKIDEEGFREEDFEDA